MAARTLGLQLFVAKARTDSDLEQAFATLSQQRVGAVLVGPSTFYTRRTKQLAALAARNRLPAIYPVREYALAGGLMSYGSNAGYVYDQFTTKLASTPGAFSKARNRPTFRCSRSQKSNWS